VCLGFDVLDVILCARDETTAGLWEAPMPNDLLVKIDGTSAGFGVAASNAQRAVLRLEVALESAVATENLTKAETQYGAGSAEAVAAANAQARSPAEGREGAGCVCARLEAPDGATGP
jgi:hypothetical protein